MGGRRVANIAISKMGGDKSFVDDLIMERGIVRVRVASVPRFTEIQPLFSDLFIILLSPSIHSILLVLEVGL